MKSRLPRIARSLIAAGLVLWFAGAGCVFVSYAHSGMLSTFSGDPLCPAHQANGDSSQTPVSEANLADTSNETIVVVTGHTCCKISATANSPHSSQPTDEVRTVANAAAVEILPGELASLPPPPGAMNCCPLMSTAVATVAKPRVSDATAAPVEQMGLPAFFGKTNTSSLSTPLRLPNRGHTYLSCCAFLI